MDLRESIEYIRDHEKELRLFNLDQTDAIQEDLRRYLGTSNVRITAGQTSSGAPASVAVLILPAIST